MPPKEVPVGASIDSEEAFVNKVVESGSAKLFVIDLYTDWSPAITGTGVHERRSAAFRGGFRLFSEAAKLSGSGLADSGASAPKF